MSSLRSYPLNRTSSFETQTTSTMSTVASASLSLLPPKPQISSKRHDNHRRLLLLNFSRRDAALLSFLSLVPSAPAPAFSVGISGPKDWLKDQKKKTAKYLLAPIDASREILRSAYLFLTDSQSEFKEKKLEEVQRLLKSAARDCVPQDRNSFVAFQANTGVEVCTFRLILKNAVSLLDKADPVKLEAEAILNDLIRSFTSLDGLANEANAQLSSDRQKVTDALMNTISSLDKFEQGVKDCLEA
ncbi:plasma membrane fusion protein [Salix suchowensis]|nr:plasma membrane fusion protein [Salix suchowensis]